MRQTALQYANAGALLAQMYRQQNQRESAVSVWRECFELAFRLAFALPIAKANVGIELASILVSLLSRRTE